MLITISIGGPPASGKTTLMRAFMSSVGPFWAGAKQGLVVYSEYASKKLIVLGDYSPYVGDFAGTDKLSMAVQPQAVALLKKWSKQNSKDGYAVLLEGDRLFNSSFIIAVRDLPLVHSYWLVLTTNPNALEARHKARGDTQDATWLKGRETKINNLMSVEGIRTIPHNDRNDTEVAVAVLKALCGSAS